MILEDFAGYEKVTHEGEEFIVLVPLPNNKAIVARTADVGGGAKIVYTFLLEKS